MLQCSNLIDRNFIHMLCFKNIQIYCLCYGFRIIIPEKTSVWNLYMNIYIYIIKPEYTSVFLHEWNDLKENINVFLIVRL